jgi:hypothetical protein
MVYITCNHKKSKPRISIGVCKRCKRRKNCPDYGNYVQPLLFAIPSAIHRRGAKPKRMRSEVSQISDRPEQLALSL